MGIFRGIQNNVKIPGSSPSYPGRVVLRIKYPYSIFFLGGGGGLILDPGIFFGFSLHDYKVKVPNFSFVEDVKIRPRLCVSFPELRYSLLELNSGNIGHLTN